MRDPLGLPLVTTREAEAEEQWSRIKMEDMEECLASPKIVSLIVRDPKIVFEGLASLTIRISIKQHLRLFNNHQGSEE